MHWPMLGDTFDLQLPLATTEFGGVTPSAVVLNATTGLLEVALAANPSALTIVGAYVRMGVRLYQIVHIATLNVYLTPGILPSANDLNSLFAVGGGYRATDDQSAHSIVRLGAHRARTHRRAAYFGWAEALE